MRGYINNEGCTNWNTLGVFLMVTQNPVHTMKLTSANDIASMVLYQKNRTILNILDYL